ncbi:uracil-DNA glycosylase [Gluconobacter kanchanaburiensis]|uniref:Uracil-DNA glycosylase n=1 Tax=Gluconobacter kanchanaburiensis NBRC 103587 TaxID=1307948 RepID=A0A511BAH6_9PROT|nr:uracil-DNA glycosylase [Gluconobacter kanchanaburiensis]MBF0861046.1 uracil-DNA glycosylase [Gluconobacter kanchanaburiensis]GBR70282.1 bacteriophage-type DNA polymerase [Gluconobacter kanchanaburiensis NBRC 103587]GEK96742.1 uracil-DNA glycosylase [Gluconobacter kanchanaburiensis NBRC 103587]
MTPQPVVSRAELLAALQLQYEWGADEALCEMPVDRLSEAPPRLPPRLSAETEPKSPYEDLRRVLKSESERSGPVGTADRNASLRVIADAPDLPTLMKLTAAPDDLFLARTATHRLEPLLVADAPFMLVGEAPDADEDRSGTLFAGEAGALLDRMLRSVGLEREKISMAPALPWRPPGGRTPSEAEMQACHPLLLRTIALGRPRYLVTMGGTPLRMLLGPDAVVGRLRGKWTKVSVPGLATPVPLLPMRHPLQLRASAAARRNAWQDLLVLMDKLASDE